MVRPLSVRARRVKRRASRHLLEEAGAMTVEFVIWFTTFILILGVVLDAAMVLYGRTSALKVVQDANRLRSIGQIETSVGTTAFIQDVLTRNITDDAVVASTVTAGILTSSAEFPIRDLELFGFLSGLSGNFTIKVGAQQMVENWEV